MQAPYIKDVYIRDKQLENGVVNLSVDFEDRYYYEILSEMVGTNIEGEYDLISLLKELSGMRNNYESLAVACNQVRGKGYVIFKKPRTTLGYRECSRYLQSNRLFIKRLIH